MSFPMCWDAGVATCARECHAATERWDTDRAAPRMHRESVTLHGTSQTTQHKGRVTSLVCGGMWNCAVLCINYIPLVIKDVPATWTQSLKSFPGKCFTALMHVGNTQKYTCGHTQRQEHTHNSLTQASPKRKGGRHICHHSLSGQK